MTQPARLTCVFTTGPYTRAQGEEGLDMVLASCALEYDIALLFINAGVFQLKRQQQVVDEQKKLYTKAFRALADMDINAVYVHDNSLLAQGLEKEDLMLDVDVLSRDKVAEVLANSKLVFTF